MLRLRALAAAPLALALALAPASVRADDAPPATSEGFAYDWVFVYYMAYDNNLEAAGRPILDMLKAGITSDRVAVVVSADFRDTEGMHRFVLTKGGEQETRLSEEGSAEEETLASELAWVSEHFQAKKYAVVFLNHGGRLGQMSYDEHPGKEGGQDWLYPPEVAKVLTKWRGDLRGSVELMFYQQCGKGTLENYHAMRKTARYVMGSQTTVGAPNRYYAATVKRACEEPGIDGLALAKEITARETDDMFTTYTTLDCEALGALPGKLDAVLEPLLALERIALPKKDKLFRPCFDFRPDEVMFDAFAFLDGLYQANGVAREPLDAFEGWVKDALIVNHRVSPARVARAGTWCGVSLFLPLSASAIQRYPDYPLFMESKLDELTKKLVTQPPEPKGDKPEGTR